ncbi:YiaA/YiaB family inner membrane protein [Klenkia terrae]|uniref:YiaA/YiaB family inner membrane protein n=1 Tax=Klenkia terrae TaxID=1052259 RepID=UPI00360EC755
MTKDNPLKNKNTSAFFAQAAIAFGISAVGLLVGVAYLPLDIWQRLFLGMTALFTITSSFTLAKVIRDAQEGSTVISRLDEARLERLLAEHDPTAPSSSDGPAPSPRLKPRRVRKQSGHPCRLTALIQHSAARAGPRPGRTRRPPDPRAPVRPHRRSRCRRPAAGGRRTRAG